MSASQADPSFTPVLDSNSTVEAIAVLQGESDKILVSSAESNVLTFEQFLKASNIGAGDHFGYTIAASDDTVVVGAPAESSNSSSDQSNNGAIGSGAVYVYVRDGETWAQQAYLKASNIDAADQFGFSVAISGDTIVVGAPFEDSSSAITPNNSASNAGAAYVFVRSGTTWTQQAYLKASNVGAGDVFGGCVSISGNTIVVGAYGEDSSSISAPSDNSASLSGAAYVFVRSGTTWTEQAYLKASNPEANDQFGIAVAISGNTIVIGANFEDGNGFSPSDNSAIQSGAAYVFERSGTTWTQQAYLKPSNTGANDQFGFGVAISGETIVVGAPGESSNSASDPSNNSAASSGAAYVFVRSDSSWIQQAYLKASNIGANDQFGSVVSISEDTILVGAYKEDSNSSSDPSNNSATDSGAAYIFTRSGSTWTQQAYLKASNIDANDWFGFSIAISGNTVAIAAHQEDSSTLSNPSNNTATDAGAAYIFNFGSIYSFQAYDDNATPDTAFAANVGTGFDGNVYAILPVGTTHLLVGGDFTSYNNVSLGSGIARLNADGTLDTSFTPSSYSSVKTIILDQDDNILIGGSFTKGLAKLSSLDGSELTLSALGSGANGEVRTIALNSAGEIFLGGTFTSFNSSARKFLAKLDVDGTLDNDFDPGSLFTVGSAGVNAMNFDSSDNLFIGGDFTYVHSAVNYQNLIKIDETNTFDSLYSSEINLVSPVNSLLVKSGNQLVVAGDFDKGITILNSDGTNNTSFDIGSGANLAIRKLAFQNSHEVLAGGLFTSFNGTTQNIVRLLVTLSQSINFPAISDKIYGNSFTLEATSPSELPITFSLISGDATLVGNELSIQGSGTIQVAADQEGNDIYEAAERVTRTFVCYPETPQVSQDSLFDEYLFITQRISKLSWNSSEDINLDRYNLYIDDVLTRVYSPTENLIYNDRDQQKNNHCVYRITAVNHEEQESEAAVISLP